MKTKLIFELNNEPANNPRELSDISVVSEWSDEVSEAEVSLAKFSLVLEEAKKIDNFIDQYSRFQGMPYNIFITDGISQEQVFNGFINLKTAVKVGCAEYQVDVEKRLGANQFSGRADAISFELLYQEGFLTNSDFVYVPYVINYIPDGTQVLILQLTLFMMGKELYEAIERFQKSITEAIKLIPDIIVGTAAEVAKVGQIAAIILNLIFQLAYLIAIVIAIIKLMNDLVRQFFPKLRYHVGIKYKNLMAAGVKYLGLEMQSTIYDSNVWGNSVYLPMQSEEGLSQPSGGIGYPRAGDSIYTLGDLIRNERQKYKAKYKITGNIYEFERKDFWKSQASYLLPDVVSDQEQADNIFRTNAEEFVGLYKINFSTDPEDKNTSDRFDGTNVAISTTLDAVLDIELDLTQGGTEIGLVEARGTRKDTLTPVEKVVRGLFKFVDLLTGILGGGTSFASKIDARIGALNLSSYITTAPKMLIMNGNKLQSGQQQLLTALKLWQEFHFIDSFNPINGIHNQRDIYENVQIPFCYEDFVTLLNNNFFNTVDNGKGEITRLEWFLEDNKAIINYKIERLETENFITNIYEG